MKSPYFWRACLGLTTAIAAPLANAAAGQDYYVDCSAAASAHPASASAAAPINSLHELNDIVFRPGARIHFKRGSTCQGSFQPKAGSSGTAAAPITVDAYGDPALPRPAIAAGCLPARRDPDQSLTEAAKTATGDSPYHSLCQSDNAPLRRAAIHLYNVEYWEIRSLDLSNDSLREGPRTGLLVQLEDFGTGHHYRIEDLYVHHVRGLQHDAPGSGVVIKETGGILFNITRNGEQLGSKQQPTSFDDVLVQNNEIYNVDTIGLSNRSAWMCRPYSSNCADYPPYSAHPEAVPRLAVGEFFPSRRLVFRNNKIHDVGGDGIIVRTASAPLVESNLIYDIWMRAAGDSAGAWAINTDDALFQYNEVHHVRTRPHMGDGMAFDADIGTWRTTFRANYSHDNEGGLMLFCACGKDGQGHQGVTVEALVEDNLSLNDARRTVVVNGAERALVRNNLVLLTQPGLDTPLIESNRFPGVNQVELRSNLFINRSGAGRFKATTHREGSYADISWSGNTLLGYNGDAAFQGKDFVEGEQANRFSVDGEPDPSRLMAQWFASSGFAQHKYQASSAP